jgi:hypothetical protein
VQGLASHPCLSNTRDQLRGAHDLALVHDDLADDDASTRLQPPLVSCIALLDRRACYLYLGTSSSLTPRPAAISALALAMRRTNSGWCSSR